MKVQITFSRVVYASVVVEMPKKEFEATAKALDAGGVVERDATERLKQHIGPGDWGSDFGAWVLDEFHIFYEERKASFNGSKQRRKGHLTPTLSPKGEEGEGKQPRSDLKK